jgi:hypothetical protein
MNKVPVQHLEFDVTIDNLCNKEHYSKVKEVKPIVRWFLRPIDRFVSWYWDRYFEEW